MKKILPIISVLFLSGCKTENIYLTVSPIERVVEVTDTIIIHEVPSNHFTKEFNRADSVFKLLQDASDKAMKEAILKCKR